MDPVTLMLVAAIVCCLGVVFFVLLAIKFRDEDFVIFLVLAAIACMGGAGTAFSECVKEAKEQRGRHVPMDVVPGQR